MMFFRFFGFIENCLLNIILKAGTAYRASWSPKGEERKLSIKKLQS